MHGIIRRSSSFNTGRISHLYADSRSHKMGGMYSCMDWQLFSLLFVLKLPIIYHFLSTNVLQFTVANLCRRLFLSLSSFINNNMTFIGFLGISRSKSPILAQLTAWSIKIAFTAVKQALWLFYFTIINNSRFKVKCCFSNWKFFCLFTAMKLHYGDLTDSTNLVKIISEVSLFTSKHKIHFL